MSQLFHWKCENKLKNLKNEPALSFGSPYLNAKLRRFDHWSLEQKRCEKIEQTK